MATDVWILLHSFHCKVGSLPPRLLSKLTCDSFDNCIHQKWHHARFHFCLGMLTLGEASCHVRSLTSLRLPYSLGRKPKLVTQRGSEERMPSQPSAVASIPAQGPDMPVKTPSCTSSPVKPSVDSSPSQYLIVTTWEYPFEATQLIPVAHKIVREINKLILGRIALQQ